MLFTIVLFAVSLLIQAGAYHLGAKFTGNPTPFKTLLVIALIGALLGAIPWIGWILAIIAALALLAKWGSMPVWPDAVLTVVIAWVLTFAAGFVLGLLLVSAAAAA